jgi:DNA (cytosine-5)-methyltransferase 1
MIHVDLFAGIGGFSLAAQRMGWDTVVQVEWDKWCQKILAKNFPDSLRFGDIVEFNKMLQNGEIITNTNSSGHIYGKYEKQSNKRWINALSQPNNGNIYGRVNIGHIDILTGGFPCQPFSVAGKQDGTGGR